LAGSHSVASFYDDSDSSGPGVVSVDALIAKSRGADVAHLAI
jgi:hypothetical protein